jgi:bacteriocin-like protein
MSGQKQNQEQKKESTNISPKPDDLTKTSKSGDIELDEEELKRVSGGMAIKG